MAKERRYGVVSRAHFENLEKEFERNDTLLHNSLCWIYEHCESDDHYEEVLRDYIGMKDEEIEDKAW